MSEFIVVRSSALQSRTPPYKLQFDGLAVPNPGQATAGAVIFAPDGRPFIERGEYYPHATNNYAEYSGLLIGLEAASAEAVPALLIEGDSQLVINQIAGKWARKDAGLRPLHARCKAIIDQHFSYVAIRHVYRASNKYADRITNEVLAYKAARYVEYRYE